MNSLPKIALIHGWATDSGIWNPVADRLESAGHSLARYEMPGYGSRRLEQGNISFNDLVDDAIDQLAEAKLWVGWSLGAMVAISAASRAALKNPNSILGVFAVCPTAKFCCDDEKQESLAKLRDAVELDSLKAVNRFQRSMPSSGNRRSIGKLLAANSTPVSKDTLLAGLDMLFRADLSAEVNKICCPTRILSGIEDQIIPATSGEAIHQLIPGSGYIALPCGHLPFLECQPLFMEQLFEFAQAIATSTTN